MQEQKKTIRISEMVYRILNERNTAQFPSMGAYADYLLQIAARTLKKEESVSETFECNKIVEEIRILREGQEILTEEVKKLYRLLDRRLGFENEKLFGLLNLEGEKRD